MPPRKKEKTTDWDGDDVKAWRVRVAKTQEEAAALTRSTERRIASYERHQRAVPPSMVLLMRYIEKFGPLPD